MTKVSIFIPSFNLGGAEKVSLELLDYLISRGYFCDFLVSSRKGSLLKNLNSKAHLFELGKGRVINSFFPFLFYIWKNDPDIIISFLTHCNVLSTVAVRLSNFLFNKNIKIIISERSSIYFTNYVKVSNLQRILTPFIGAFYNLSDTIITPSLGIKEELISVRNIKSNLIEVIPNTLDIDFIHSLSKQEPLFNIDHHKPFVISIARLTYQKDFHTLLLAFKYIVFYYNRNIKLIIIGDGPNRHEIESLINEYNLSSNIFLLGSIDNPFPYLNISNVFVLSSNCEGFPNVLLQALSLGIPIVSTNCKHGPAEILDHGKWGILVKPKDHIGLAKSIIKQFEFSISNKHKKPSPRIYDFNKYSIYLKYEKIIGNLLD